jgi:sugar lactone lactonase YvrE
VRVDDQGNMTVLWHAARAINGSPVVGGGRIWVLAPQSGVLHALDPATGRSLAQIRVGVANRFATPALYGTDVVVPTLGGFSVVRTS